MKIMGIDFCCIDCQWWDEANKLEVPRKQSEAWTAECRAKHPTREGWACTYHDDWCGKFQAKEKDNG